MTSDHDILIAAQAVRAALERCCDLLDLMETFPRGTCGRTSDLLATYLAERKLGAFRIVSAEGFDLGVKSHAYLRWDELVVDITADQFGEAPVIASVAGNASSRPLPKRGQIGSGAGSSTTTSANRTAFNDRRCFRRAGDKRSTSHRYGVRRTYTEEPVDAGVGQVAARGGEALGPASLPGHEATE